MIQLSTESINIEGVTLYRDHARENLFWYHETPVALARRNNSPQFTMVTFRPSTADAGVEGGGFLMLESEIKLDESTKRRVKSRLSSMTDEEPILAPVPYDDGEVQIMALDLQGAGGTTQEELEPGAFVAVEKIFGTSKPSLAGNNSAVFGLKLSQDGAQIMEAVFKAGGKPVGIIYSLTYTALRPSLEARIEANFKRIYDHFSMGIDLNAGAVVGGVPIYLRAGIEYAVDKLVQSGAIKMTITNFSTDSDRAEKEKMLLDFFTETLLKDFFKPSMQPVQPAQPNPTQPIPRLPGSPSPTDPTPTDPTPTDPTPTDPTPTDPTPTDPTPTDPTPTDPTPTDPTPTDPTPTDPAPGTPPLAPINPAPIVPPTGDQPTPPNDPNPQPPGNGGGGGGGGGGEGDADPSSMALKTDLPGAAIRDTPQPPQMGVQLSFALKKVKQQEDKFALLEYNRTEAVERVYAAQGLVGLLAEDLDESHFIKVDLDGTFFRKLDIVVQAPDNIFENLGLAAVDVAVDYGNADDEDHIKHKDFRFQPGQNNQGTAAFFLNRSLDLHYSLTVQYHFDPLAGWEGERISYEMPARPTFDRTLMVNPFNDLGFMQVKIAPADMDAVMLESTDVHLRYDDGDWVTEKVMQVRPDSEEQSWNLRLSKPEIRNYQYHFVHHLRNGDVVQSDPVQQSASMIPVNDPFEDPLIIEFFPNYDGSSIKQLFVDVSYDDEANDYHRSGRVTFSGSEVDSKQLRFARMNTQLGEFSYRVTILGNDNSVRRIEPVVSSETLVFLGQHVTG